MNKKYIVRLSEQERAALEELTRGLKGGQQKVRRANILLLSDADGPNWKDDQIAEAYRCSRQTVDNVRKRFLTCGFDQALVGKVREVSPVLKNLDGRQQAELIALRLGKPSRDTRVGRWGCWPERQWSCPSSIPLVTKPFECRL